MVCLNACIIFLIYFVCLIVDARFPSPFDIRIDHHKVEITRDLVINTPRPRFSWKIGLPDMISNRNVEQNAYQIQLQSIKLSENENKFEWDSEEVVSSQSIHVRYTGDTDLFPSRYYRFRLRVWIKKCEEGSEWTDWIEFRTAIFNLNEYMRKDINPVWIGSTKIHMNELRKEFIVQNKSPIISAIVYISGIGYYQFYLNGNKVDPTRKLDPGWTYYYKRTLLVSFDVTSNITIGMNAVGVKLGNGWYSQEQNREFIYGPPRLIFTLLIRFENGDKMEVLSDETWRGRDGSIRHDSIFNGEMYDARNDRPDWARPGFNDSLSAWIMPEILPSPLNDSINGSLVLQDMPPIREGLDALHIEIIVNASEQSYLKDEDIGDIKGASLTDGGILKPISIWRSESGILTFDLGQNMAGLCRFKFQGPLGYGTYIRHGEVLVQLTVAYNHSTANIYTENLREATQSDSYILYGDPISEIYEPTFTIHGFRYVSVFGPPNALTIDDIECPVIHSETTLKGSFRTSNPIVNQIQHNIQWSQISNLMSVPTDCPQRSERRGWMGDAALSVNEALYNFDLIKFYINFLNLIVDGQLEDGEIPDFVPGNHYPPDSNWGTALPTITWQLYQHYGDLNILESYYHPVRSYVEYLRSQHNITGLANFFCKFGDWVPPPPHNMTNRHLITSFGFLHDVYILINISEALGKKNDTDFYSSFYKELTQEFHNVFFNDTSNFYGDGMQSAQVFALALPDLVPSNVRDAVINHLVNDINQNGNHVTTGIISTAQIYPVLSDNGHHDLALEMISSTTYPSYGFMFTNPYENATTLWELWNTGIGGPGMNSRNHIMFGSVGAWFYSHLAGIDYSSDIINIRPRMASESKKHLMLKLDCQLSTLYGIIHLSYTRDQNDTIENSILLRLRIPPNAKARLIFEPLFVGGQCHKIIENNQIIWSSDHLTTINQQFNVQKDQRTGLISLYIHSGQYQFQAIWK